MSIQAQARASCFTQNGVPREIVELALAIRPAMPLLRFVSGYIASVVPGATSSAIAVLETLQSGDCRAERFTSQMLRSWSDDLTTAGIIWGIVGTIATIVGGIATVVTGGAGAPSLLLSFIAAAGAIALALGRMLDDAADGELALRSQVDGATSILLRIAGAQEPDSEAAEAMRGIVYALNLVPDLRMRIFADVNAARSSASSSSASQDKKAAMKAAKAKMAAQATRAARELEARAATQARAAGVPPKTSAGGGAGPLVALGLLLAAAAARRRT